MRKIMVLILTGTVLLGTGVFAAQQEEQVYGWQLMNKQEQYEYQQKMREMKTAEEREAYRYQHHEMMQERAKQKGLTLPEAPGAYGKGMGPKRKLLKGDKP